MNISFLNDLLIQANQGDMKSQKMVCKIYANEIQRYKNTCYEYRFRYLYSHWYKRLASTRKQQPKI